MVWKDDRFWSIKWAKERSKQPESLTNKCARRDGWETYPERSFVRLPDLSYCLLKLRQSFPTVQSPAITPPTLSILFPKWVIKLTKKGKTNVTWFWWVFKTECWEEDEYLRPYLANTYTTKGLGLWKAVNSQSSDVISWIVQSSASLSQFIFSSSSSSSSSFFSDLIDTLSKNWEVLKPHPSSGSSAGHVGSSSSTHNGWPRHHFLLQQHHQLHQRLQSYTFCISFNPIQDKVSSWSIEKETLLHFLYRNCPNFKCI